MIAIFTQDSVKRSFYAEIILPYCSPAGMEGAL